MRDTMKELLHKLEQEVPIVQVTSYDHDVRKVYMDSSLRLLHLLKESEAITQRQYQTIHKIRNKINQIWINYLYGRVNTASSQMQNLLKWKLDQATMLDYLSKEKACHHLYRGRCSTKPFDQIDAFYHIPFTMRYLIGNQRYSLSGIPCLYLAGSIPCVQAELNYPKTADLQLCSFHSLAPRKLLDLSEGYQELNQQEQDAAAFLYTLPLKLACSIWAKDNQQGSFKTNYVIPQLITATLYNMNTDLEGICFSSIKGAALPYEDRCNYVFLPQYRIHERYDQQLLAKFQISFLKDSAVR